MKLLQKYWPKRWVATTLVVVAIIYLTLVPRPLPDEMPSFEGMDKLAHFCMFGGLAGVSILDYFRNGQKFSEFSPTPAIIICAASLLFGIAIEIIQQAMNMGRGGDVIDACADALGVAAAYPVARLILKYYHRHDTDS